MPRIGKENGMIDSKWFLMGDTEAMAEAWTIRDKVFIQEQGFSRETERDGVDAAATHLLIRDGGVPVATGRLYRRDDGRYFIGRVAVLPEFRRQHLGDLLMRMLIRRARNLGAGDVWVDSQSQAVPFYTALGFTRQDEGHLDEGVLHYYMRLPAEKEPPRCCEGRQ